MPAGISCSAGRSSRAPPATAWRIDRARRRACVRPSERVRAPVEAEPLALAELNPGPIVIREHRDQARARAADAGNPVQGVLAREDVERAGRQGIDAYPAVLATQRAADARVIGIGVGAQVAAVLEFPAVLGGLDQQGGGVDRAVEMPVERLPGPIFEDVHARER